MMIKASVRTPAWQADEFWDNLKNFRDMGCRFPSEFVRLRGAPFGVTTSLRGAGRRGECARCELERPVRPDPRATVACGPALRERRRRAGEERSEQSRP
jgi:hypothetical protein